MRPTDITADENGNEGRYMLRRWLEYCEQRGQRAATESTVDASARLAEHIGVRLRQRGLDVDYRVGTTGHRVDLAVRHPEWEHGYLCGIDCDGEEYYAARSARDRDILRQQVLEGLGWRLYRVWSVNWYTDEEAELERLLAWIDECLAEATRRTEAEMSVSTTSAQATVESHTAATSGPADAATPAIELGSPSSTEEDAWYGPPTRARAGDLVALELPNGSVIRPRLVRSERHDDNHHAFSVTWSPGNGSSR
jgi:hypothetical protein